MTGLNDESGCVFVSDPLPLELRIRLRAIAESEGLARASVGKSSKKYIAVTPFIKVRDVTKDTNVVVADSPYASIDLCTVYLDMLEDHRQVLRWRLGWEGMPQPYHTAVVRTEEGVWDRIAPIQPRSYLRARYSCSTDAMQAIVHINKNPNLRIEELRADFGVMLKGRYLVTARHRGAAIYCLQEQNGYTSSLTNALRILIPSILKWDGPPKRKLTPPSCTAPDYKFNLHFKRIRRHSQLMPTRDPGGSPPAQVSLSDNSAPDWRIALDHWQDRPRHDSRKNSNGPDSCTSMRSNHSLQSADRGSHYSAQSTASKKRRRQEKADNAYECVDCSKLFDRASDRDKHWRNAHQDVRPHACMSCEKTFRYPKDLRRHQAVHSANAESGRLDSMYFTTAAEYCTEVEDFR